eukprot:CAMPEP_0177590608 /NCGR_PEP_ID=MMETSP0419_2-20121207/7509_1 /TAXON_ID=582737 /ORGANISM="Tetraselmis sp., Strain GSL018" /LENGTH=183 /DNA_ID=CAMNT_0019081203 /DNA_START=213 /DNA_END=765 /DNA_ORIENTATION=+
MPPSQGHHVEDSGTLLGQSMGTSASALPSLDGSANVTAAEARAHARSRAALPALAVIRPRRTVEADLVTVPETAAVGVVVVEPRPCSRQPLLLTGRTPTLRRRCPRPPEHEHVGPCWQRRAESPRRSSLFPTTDHERRCALPVGGREGVRFWEEKGSSYFLFIFFGEGGILPNGISAAAAGED